MTEERRTIGYNPLDPRDRIERGRERAAWFRRADMMGAVALAMTVFVALGIARRELAMAYLVAMMFLPLLIMLALMLVNVLARRIGRSEPVPLLPAPAMLVIVSTGLFFLLADPVSPLGLGGLLVLIVSGWLFARRQATGASHNG